MGKIKFSLTIILLTVWQINIHAQKANRVSGKVIQAETKLASPGATISNKNHKAITNNNGEFTITATAEDTLIITSIGFEAKYVPLKYASENLVIELKKIATELEEVTV